MSIGFCHDHNFYENYFQVGGHIHQTIIDKSLCKLLYCTLIEKIFNREGYSRRRIDRYLALAIFSVNDSMILDGGTLDDHLEEARDECKSRGIFLYEKAEDVYDIKILAE